MNAGQAAEAVLKETGVNLIEPRSGLVAWEAKWRTGLLNSAYALERMEPWKRPFAARVRDQGVSRVIVAVQRSVVSEQDLAALRKAVVLADPRNAEPLNSMLDHCVYEVATRLCDSGDVGELKRAVAIITNFGSDRYRDEMLEGLDAALLKQAESSTSMQRHHHARWIARLMTKENAEEAGSFLEQLRRQPSNSYVAQTRFNVTVAYIHSVELRRLVMGTNPASIEAIYTAMDGGGNDSQRIKAGRIAGMGCGLDSEVATTLAEALVDILAKLPEKTKRLSGLT